ncbi:unnamed protein product [Boreogadus saida]
MIYVFVCVCVCVCVCVFICVCVCVCMVGPAGVKGVRAVVGSTGREQRRMQNGDELGRGGGNRPHVFRTDYKTSPPRRLPLSRPVPSPPPPPPPPPALPLAEGQSSVKTTISVASLKRAVAPFNLQSNVTVMHRCCKSNALL